MEPVLYTQERRKNEYRFASMRSLIHYFQDFLPEIEVLTIIADNTMAFKPRKDISDEETGLQLVRKCEESLFRRILETGSNPLREGS